MSTAVSLDHVFADGPGSGRARVVEELLDLLDRLRSPLWHFDALCREPAPPGANWFPESGETLAAEKAMQVCGRCLVREECLAWALEHGEEGVWGGLSKQDRNWLLAWAGGDVAKALTGVEALEQMKGDKAERRRIAYEAAKAEGRTVPSCERCRMPALVGSTLCRGCGRQERQERQHRVRELWRDRRSVQEIAAELCIGTATVYADLSVLELAERRAGGPHHKDQPRAVVPTCSRCPMPAPVGATLCRGCALG